jgi:hypothetical protein
VAKVFISHSSTDTWVAKQIARNGARVIPILAKGANPQMLPPLLRDRVYVDASALNDPEIQGLLRKALADQVTDEEIEASDA